MEIELKQRKKVPLQQICTDLKSQTSKQTNKLKTDTCLDKVFQRLVRWFKVKSTYFSSLKSRAGFSRPTPSLSQPMYLQLLGIQYYLTSAESCTYVLDNYTQTHIQTFNLK